DNGHHAGFPVGAISRLICGTLTASGLNECSQVFHIDAPPVAGTHPTKPAARQPFVDGPPRHTQLLRDFLGRVVFWHQIIPRQRVLFWAHRASTCLIYTTRLAKRKPDGRQLRGSACLSQPAPPMPVRRLRLLGQRVVIPVYRWN